MESKDAETMTEQPTFTSVKTNTSATASCNVGTSVEIGYDSVEIMTEDAFKELSESGVQTQCFDSASLEIQTDPIGKEKN
mgnify:CR=1 FL=1